MTLWRQVQSAQNPLVQRLRKLVADPMAYRKLGQCWLEGEHLVLAARARDTRASLLVLTESASVLQPTWTSLAGHAADAVCLPDALWASLSSVPAASGIGCLMDVPVSSAVVAQVPSLVLDRLQDAGNVGSILRSAAAMGVGQVVALRGTAGLWSPKVLRAGMGAHWALHLVEGLTPEGLSGLDVPLVMTSSHGGVDLHEAALPQPCAWVFGNEGQGVGDAVAAHCSLRVRIPQPGGEESLNAAAAAAVCLYESMRRRLAP